ncbi:transmembrane protein, putative (macronuclear) [Tetrahymena thermophila SB210]|uniref:Transmembrane protein, putative n=1 Tax=Tetrahymena thermophila (strain SB210) TaxID=312017 RepID=Q231R3_TETTS|nr:transmembrane protein, putative [Tetrahymena thermophila SB210]EAR91239.2 transmembrane protein, putative [Tetrahymena thermophila SB210]|eukprot:XP_001011484.2 transmembrane protein, putative [Tetrahymena thermophila SB210]
MSNNFIQKITEEEEEYLENLGIYKKFPYLKEENQKFNQFAESFIKDYNTDSRSGDNQIEYSSQNLKNDLDLQNNQSNSSNEIEQTKSPKSNTQSKMLNSSHKNFDSRLENVIYQSPQQFQDSTNDNKNESDHLKIRSSHKLETFQDSPYNEEIKKTSKMSTDSQTSEEKIKKNFFIKLVDNILTRIKNLVFQDYDSQFYGLDNQKINLDEIKKQSDGRITYKNKQDLKTITFLTSGYLTQDIKVSINFLSLANTNKIDCQDNLFIFFRWSDSSLLDIAKLFDKCQKKPSIYKYYFYSLINNFLMKHFSDITITAIYWLAIAFEKYLELYPPLLNGFIKGIKCKLDKMIQNFKQAYQEAKNSGAVLAKCINKLNLMGNLNIDFIGHSLGTVVIAYALRDLSIPARYLMLFGGAATTQEIEVYQHNFQKCYNFYSDHDKVIQAFLKYAKLIDDQDFIGVKSFGQIKDKFFNLNTKIDHMVYILEFDKYYNTAMAEFNKSSNSIDLIEKPNIMKIGFGGLLLYLLKNNSQSNQVSVIYMFILYIYYLFK